VGIWVGTDDHASLGEGHTGTEDAMPIWADIMTELHRGLKVKDFETEFPRPQGISDVRICMLTGRIAQGFCDSTVQDYRISGSARPMPLCRPELHGFKPGALGKAKEKEKESQSGKESGKQGSFLKGLWERLRRKN
jgi:membrane carboxypeptidase/penicillin-binding protein